MSALQAYHRIERELAYQANIGHDFQIDRTRCRVIKVKEFNGVPHYGFCTLGNDKLVLFGYVPCALVGQMWPNAFANETASH